MNRFKALTVVAGLVVTGLAPVSASADTSPSTWVVDRDGAECSNADFTSIQAAVDAAAPGDVIRVCPDLYPESVTVDKPLTLVGDPDAVEAVDCFNPAMSQPGDADPTRQTIVDPAGAGFTVGFRLAADGVVLSGLVVQGASVGVDASDRFSGYRVHHNLIRLNMLFGVDFGSEGTHESRVDHNCIRENGYGLVSELDDDSLWKDTDGPERDEWNARDLRNARLDHNATFRNGAGLEAAGPGRRDLVTFDHNVSREDAVGIALQNATLSAIVENEVTSSGFGSIFLGGGNEGLEVDSNIVQGGGFGVRFAREGFIDFFAAPSPQVLVTENEIRGAAAGIFVGAATLVASLIFENTTSDNLRIGINMMSSGNVVRANHANNNGLVGVNAFFGATGNRFEQNSMHGNVLFDARDLNAPSSNRWIDNDCLTDFPAGTICGLG
jgi:nitrous oxidase accessory protein NosD